MRPRIPNWMAGSREGPQQCSMCRSTEHGVQGYRHLHTPLSGGSLGSPPPPLCPPASAPPGHPQLRVEKVRLQEEP